MGPRVWRHGVELQRKAIRETKIVASRSSSKGGAVCYNYGKKTHKRAECNAPKQAQAEQSTSKRSVSPTTVHVLKMVGVDLAHVGDLLSVI
ncbi:hypothetical protein Droror1_Dr00023292 [Drosera rotundifolia]